MPMNEPSVNISELNRAISTVIGATAVLWGVQGGAIRRMVMVPLGAAMIHRGLTGHCALTQQLDQQRTKREDDERVDLMSEESFPASDPPAY